MFVILLVLDPARYFAEMLLCTILQIDIRFICYHWIIYGCYNDLYWEVCARQITWFFNKIRLKVYSKHERIHVWIILVSSKIEVSAAILCGKSWQHGNFSCWIPMLACKRRLIQLWSKRGLWWFLQHGFWCSSDHLVATN